MNSFFASFIPDKLSKIPFNDYTLLLAAFPVWRSFICAAGTDIWVEIVPDIDLKKKSISVPKRKSVPLFEDPEQLKIRSENVQKFFASIPENIYSAALKFPDSHWELIRAANLIGDDFINLLHTNPCLAYLIVNIEKFNSSFKLYSSIALLQRLIKRKRKEIAGLCGFPETSQMVNILAKTRVELIDLKLLIKLKTLFVTHPALAERFIYRLSFLHSINKNLLALLISYPHLLELLKDNILQALIGDDLFKIKIEMLQNLYERSQSWNIPFPNNISADNLPELLDKMEAKIMLRTRFPDPPFPGNEFIFPLTSEAELTSWSKRQQNCVRSYSSKVRNKKSFIYKVNYNGEEATLETIITQKQIRIKELKGYKNAAVTSELRDEVNKWIKTSKIVLPNKIKESV